MYVHMDIKYSSLSQEPPKEKIPRIYSPRDNYAVYHKEVHVNFLAGTECFYCRATLRWRDKRSTCTSCKMNYCEKCRVKLTNFHVDRCLRCDSDTFTDLYDNIPRHATKIEVIDSNK